MWSFQVLWGRPSRKITPARVPVWMHAGANDQNNAWARLVIWGLPRSSPAGKSNAKKSRKVGESIEWGLTWGITSNGASNSTYGHQKPWLSVELTKVPASNKRPCGSKRMRPNEALFFCGDPSGAVGVVRSAMNNPNGCVEGLNSAAVSVMELAARSA
jgi:hypothetical protein